MIVTLNAQDAPSVVDRLIEQMPPDSRDALIEELQERGLSIEALNNDPAALREMMKPANRDALQKAVEARLERRGMVKLDPRTPQRLPRSDIAYYNIIMEKNLFRALGWAPPTPH
ncbi:MAG: hypothetical protein O3A46_16570, partial [Candidatus Poribacteria bacterium]|nr:hypothetical protein [Candidatus Poribacteria bacterium]